jgi:hypothetical protein
MPRCPLPRAFAGESGPVRQGGSPLLFRFKITKYRHTKAVIDGETGAGTKKPRNGPRLSEGFAADIGRKYQERTGKQAYDRERTRPRHPGTASSEGISGIRDRSRVLLRRVANLLVNGQGCCPLGQPKWPLPDGKCYLRTRIFSCKMDQFRSRRMSSSFARIPPPETALSLQST